MLKLPLNEAIEDRIDYEITADACRPEEIATGWYVYVKEKLRFPFQAKCNAQDDSSPLKTGEVVEVLEMAPSYTCNKTLLVKIRFLESTLTAPLSQLEGLSLIEEENEAIHDWHYWVAQGYQFS